MGVTMNVAKKGIKNKIIGLGMVAGLVTAAMAQATPRNLPPEAYRYVSMTMHQTMRATCSGRMSPDYAEISGGLSVQSMKPEEAIAKINERVKDIRRFVSRNGGKLILKERIRSVRQFMMPNPYNPYRGHVMPQPPAGKKPEQKMPPATFIFIQRLSVEMPVNAKIDKMMVGLVNLGLNQFGQLNSHYSYNRGNGGQVLVFYKFRNLEQKLDTIKEKCVVTAISDWCRVRVGAYEQNSCVKAVQSIRSYLNVGSISLQAGPILMANGQMRPIHIPYPWQKRYLDQLVLVGNVPVNISGQIYIRGPRRGAW